MKKNNNNSSAKGEPRRVRFKPEDEKIAQAIAAKNGIDVIDALRMATHIGLPLLSEKLGVALPKEPAKAA